VIELTSDECRLLLLLSTVALRVAEGQRNGASVRPEVAQVRAKLMLAVRSVPADGQIVATATEAVPPSTEEIDIPAAATRMGCSVWTVRRRCASGKLPARRLGRTWLVRMELENVDV
jgi:excisionase family DNA binding protein